MYVWAEAEKFRISIQGGIAYCQVWEPPGLSSGKRTELAAELSGAGRRMLERGLRPLGLVLDLRRTTEPKDAPTRLALAALVGAWERARLPIAVLCGAAPAARDGLQGLVSTHAPRQARLVEKLHEAEAWIHGGAGRIIAL